ncbi:hypothetical protein [Modestobacter italicus]|uniref:hypothetical protein n=1 Tax=Modestobacter italicus (strain DSM 44449 / CECT 9708 / BC 501) TaxID=2732864 RepID=UPI001C942573|nr:hypothetical protein [Modestobacter italicus]
MTTTATPGQLHPGGACCGPAGPATSSRWVHCSSARTACTAPPGCDRTSTPGRDADSCAALFPPLRADLPTCHLPY